MSEAIQFERRAGEKTVIELAKESDAKEIELTILEMTATRCKMQVEPGSAVKRVMKVEK